MIAAVSFVLSCCSEKNTEINRAGEALSDGTKTYYIDEYDASEHKIHSTRYKENGSKIEEYNYSYSYDINGNLYSVSETDVNTGKSVETIYNKYKQKTFEITYDKEKRVTEQKEFMKNGNIKKKTLFSNGSETGYILYDYYADNQLKNKTEYSVNGKTLKITTYYKNNLLYQIKEFDKNGMVERITKYSYKGDKLYKKSVYDSDYNLSSTIDYSKKTKATEH